MASFLGSARSTESPMDFEYTHRPAVRPAWAAPSSSSTPGDPSTPRKRPLAELQSFDAGAPHTPTFGRMPSDIPFMLSVPPPHTPHRDAWVPPAGAYTEIRDVDMAEASPPALPRAPHCTEDQSRGSREEGPGEERHEEREGEERSREERSRERTIALGGLRRVFRSRRRLRERSRPAGRARVDDASESESGSEDGADGARVAQTTSNHYTLNLPAPGAPRADTPYVLLGYLQFFFNLSLILVFLYLLVQFILTVQRDVEHRISEYSMDIVQEIAQCALQYRTNLCATNPIPAMAHQCGLWETCMNRDPSKVGRARVGAELIAEVVNGFVEPISWKTLAFTLTSLSFLTVFVNSLLSLYRSRHQPPHAPHAPPPLPAYPHPAPYPHPALLGAPPAWGKGWLPAGADVAELAPRRRKLESGAAKEVA